MDKDNYFYLWMTVKKLKEHCQEVNEPDLADEIEELQSSIHRKFVESE